MVLGLGIDLVDVERLAAVDRSHGRRFLQRCFRPPERVAIAADPQRRHLRLAQGWAAKEALLKALGGTLGGIPYRDIEVAAPAAGPAALVLHGRAAGALRRMGGRRVWLCLGQDGRCAVATVVIEA